MSPEKSFALIVTVAILAAAGCALDLLFAKSFFLFPNSRAVVGLTIMLGIFIGVWHDLPLEAVTVWLFCSLVIMVYEYIKICYFTPRPSTPGHKLLLKVGTEWRSPK